VRTRAQKQEKTTFNFNKGKAMKLRIPFICLLGLTAAIFALPGHARGLLIDQSTCPTTVSATGNLWIELPGTGKKANRAKAGVNFPVLNCSPPLGLPSSTLSQLPYDPANSLLYTWIDLAVAGVAGDTLQDVLNTTRSGLASLFAVPLNDDTNATAAIVAQVAVLKLNQGGYEILFNYQNDILPTTACLNAFKPLAPSLTWFKTTYVFTGVGGVATPCDSTNDFVFGPSGALLGYIDNTHTLIAGALPPGWAIK
jgi:hypothetical protein